MDEWNILQARIGFPKKTMKAIYTILQVDGHGATPKRDHDKPIHYGSGERHRSFPRRFVGWVVFFCFFTQVNRHQTTNHLSGEYVCYFFPSIDMQQIQGGDTVTIQGSYNTPWYRSCRSAIPRQRQLWKESLKNSPGWYRLPFRGVFQFGVVFHNLGITIGETSKAFDFFWNLDWGEMIPINWWMHHMFCFKKESWRKQKKYRKNLLWVVNWTHKKVSKRS